MTKQWARALILKDHGQWGTQMRGWLKTQDAPGATEKAIEVAGSGSHIIVGVARSEQKPGGMKRYI